MVTATRVQLTLDEPHAGQDQLTAQAKRFNVVVCGRRWGKSTDAIGRAVEPLLRGKPVGWFNPTYPNLTESWRTVANALEPITARRSEQEHRIECVTGGVLECWSLDAPDSARGRAYARVIGDELAMARLLEMAWQNVIRPTLTDYEGDAWLYSTPRGRNFFHALYQRGQDTTYPDWRSWRFPSSANPHLPKGEIEVARRELPERVFAQEYLAQFLEDSGGVFRNVTRVSTATPQKKALPGHDYVMGVDWGRTNDFTVLTVWDLTTKRQAALERFNNIDALVQVSRFEALWARFRPLAALAEQNSIGGPMIDLLRRKYGHERILGWVATNATKAAMIDSYALGFEQEGFTLLNDPAQIAEHQAFEATRLPSGLLRYAAPEGLHDDTVIANALAHLAMQAPRGVGHLTIAGPRRSAGEDDE